jgi:DNA-binding phage protein
MSRYSTTGGRRIASDWVVRRALKWQRERKTAVQIARELGVTTTTLYKAVKGANVRRSARFPGRPRKLRGEALALARRWYRMRRTRRQLAQELGLSRTVLGRLLQIKGQYKAAPPERRDAVLKARRALMKRLEARCLL